jgi:hypothetical protein
MLTEEMERIYSMVVTINCPHQLECANYQSIYLGRLPKPSKFDRVNFRCRKLRLKQCNGDKPQ